MVGDLSQCEIILLCFCQNQCRISYVVHFVTTLLRRIKMKSFTATVNTDAGRYDIDYKANKSSHNWCVMHSTGAVYLCSIQEALDWINNDVNYIISQTA